MLLYFLCVYVFKQLGVLHGVVDDVDTLEQYNLKTSHEHPLCTAVYNSNFKQVRGSNLVLHVPVLWPDPCLNTQDWWFRSHNAITRTKQIQTPGNKGIQSKSFKSARYSYTR